MALSSIAIVFVFLKLAPWYVTVTGKCLGSVIGAIPAADISGALRRIMNGDDRSRFVLRSTRNNVPFRHHRSYFCRPLAASIFRLWDVRDNGYLPVHG